MVMRSPILNVMGNAALKAARGLIRDFGEVEHLQVSIKGAGDFVSTADLKAERTLKTELKKARPGYSMCSKKAGQKRDRMRDIAGLSIPSTARRTSYTGFPISRSRSRWNAMGISSPA